MSIYDEYLDLLARIAAAAPGPDRDAMIDAAHDLWRQLLEIGQLAATTPGGLPYPVPTDPLSAGADAIKALALALDPYARPTITSAVPSTVLTATEVSVTLVNLTAGTWDVDMKAGASWSTVGAPRFILRLRQGTVAGTELDQVQTYTTVTTGDVPVLLSKPKLVLAVATDILVTGQATGTTGGSSVLNNLVLKARRTA